MAEDGTKRPRTRSNGQRRSTRKSTGSAAKAPAKKPKATSTVIKKTVERTSPQRKSIRKSAKSDQARVEAGVGQKAQSQGFDIAKLVDHPLVADLLAVGAMAAVAAIADHSVRSRTGEIQSGSSKAVKAAGKAAAAAIGKRLLSEVNQVRRASKGED